MHWAGGELGSVRRQETDPKKTAGAFLIPAGTPKGLRATQALLGPGTERLPFPEQATSN